MGILVTPKNQAEVNQLVSVLHSAGYKHFLNGTESSGCTHFEVGSASLIWTTSKEYCYVSVPEAIIPDHDVPLTVNELGQYLQGN